MKKNYLAILITALVVISNPAFAGTKIYSPNIEKGELELELQSNYAFDKKDKDGSKDTAQKYKYAIGYGFTDYYFGEIYLIAKNTADKSYEAEAIEWENIFQLTENGKNFADVGLYLSFKKALESKEEHDALEAKILLEKQTGRFINRLNLGIESQLRQVDGDKADKGAEVSVSFMTKYAWREYLEPGFEYYAEFGNYTQSNSYSNQSHQVGPNIYGQIGRFKYDLGLLFGTSKAAIDKQLKLNLEYEFYL